MTFSEHTAVPLTRRRALGVLSALGIALVRHAQAQTSPTNTTATSTKIATSTTSTQTMSSFVILFRQGPYSFTDAELARRQADVSTWARTQNAAGHKLEPRILAPAATRGGASAPADAWPVTALLFLEAENLEAATAVANSHPALIYNVAIEVRPWGPPAPPSPR